MIEDDRKYLPEGRSDDPLDGLLARARWAEPTAGAERRLADAWERHQELRRRRMRIRRGVFAVLSAAAVILIAIGVQHRLARKALSPMEREIVRVPARAPAGESPSPREKPSPIVSRPATPYERWVMKSVEAPKKRQTPVVAVQRPRPADGLSEDERVRRVAQIPAARQELLARLVGHLGERQTGQFLQLVLDPQSRKDALAALHDTPAPDRAAGALLAQLDDPHVSYRLAAARALGALCVEPVRDRLQQMVLRDDHRREALAALLSCSSPDASQFLTDVRGNRSIGMQLRLVEMEMKPLN